MTNGTPSPTNTMFHVEEDKTITVWRVDLAEGWPEVADWNSFVEELRGYNIDAEPEPDRFWLVTDADWSTEDIEYILNNALASLSEVRPQGEPD